ncbi:hypothetical protein, partial [Streptomyces antimycoticus]
FGGRRFQLDSAPCPVGIHRDIHHRNSFMGASKFDQIMAKNADRNGGIPLGGDVVNAKSFPVLRRFNSPSS